MVGVNETPMFDDMAYTQGGMPHLVQFLWDEYKAHLTEEIEKRKAEGQPTKELADALPRVPAISFLQWAANYLKENRYSSHLFVDENHAVVLSNQKTFVISPGIPIRGTMQEAHAVNVSKGESQRGMEGVAPSTVLKI
jgi:hypothetical protein